MKSLMASHTTPINQGLSEMVFYSQRSSR